MRLRVFILLLSLLLGSVGKASSCGPQVNVFERLLTDAEEVRLKCIDDYYAEKKAERERLIVEVQQLIKEKELDLEKSAFKFDKKLNRVRCQNPNGDRDQTLVKKCEEDLKIYNALIAQLDQLMGWNIVDPDRNKSVAELQAQGEPPCPDQATMEKIKPLRLYRKHLYQLYERCAVLNAGS